MFYAVEDQLSEALFLKILTYYNLSNDWVRQLGRMSGDGDIVSNISKYEELSKRFPVFVLLDLDRRSCPVSYRSTISKHFSSSFVFRIAVTEAESWLMADADGFSNFLGAEKSSILARQDWTKIDAKEALLDAVQRLGKKTLKEQLLPRHDSRANVGLEYNSALGQFVRGEWSPERARQNSDSLESMIKRISQAVPPP